MGIGVFHNPMVKAGEPAEWTAPEDWIDITNVGDNEINLLVGDFGNATVAFSVTIGGTYTIDWGDGIIETSRVNNIIYEHTYASGIGTPCSLGYTTFKVRIFEASSDILIFRISTSVLYNNHYNSLLWMVIGAKNLTSLDYLVGISLYLEQIIFPDILDGVVTALSPFGTLSYSLQSIKMPTSMVSLSGSMANAFINCRSLKKVIFPLNVTGITSLDSAFENCSSLEEVVLPTTLNSLTTLADAFLNCFRLRTVELPTSLNLVNSLSSTFENCYSLRSVSLPATMSSLLTMANCFLNCQSLGEIILPTSAINVTNLASTFKSCLYLKSLTLPPFTNVSNATQIFNSCLITSIINEESLGSTSSNVDGYLMFQQTKVTGEIEFNARFTRFGCVGASSNKQAITSIRLLNGTSTYSGASPQIDIKYNDLSKTALEVLFDDLPVNMSGKTIAITGCTGTDALISKASSGTTAGSVNVTMSNTSSLVVGMEVYGTGISTAVSCSFQEDGDTVTKAGHGLTNGMKVSFASITTTTGISLYTPYFVVNATTDTFQVSLTSGGAALTLTNNGSGTYLTYPKIVNIVTNVRIELDRPCSATGTVTATAGVLERSRALLKGWTITN